MDLEYFLEDLLEGGIGSIMSIMGVLIGLVFLLLIFGQLINMINIFKITRMLKTWKSVVAFMTPNMGMLGKTREQKKVVRYFKQNRIVNIILLVFLAMFIFYIINNIKNEFHLGTLPLLLMLLVLGISLYFIIYSRKRHQMTNSSFDALMNSKADEIASKIEERALEVHGMDADEVKEIPPILAENYYPGSRYFKYFKDHSFRASEYQMTYLMFSEKQVYAYSYIFDLTSAETNEQTKEYFYEDITTMDISKKQTEFPDFRPVMEYILGGIACLVIGFLIMLFSKGATGSAFFSILFLVAGAIIVIVAVFSGFTRRLVESLILRLTVANDEFVCAMKPENIEAIQGMKAKIRDKKS